jgi:hypothetical protein
MRKVWLLALFSFTLVAACETSPTLLPHAAPTTPSPIPTSELLPGQALWKNGVSSFLFGTNDTQEWSEDNIQTDPYHSIQASLKSAHFTLMRTFFFHYSLYDGHRTTIGTTPANHDTTYKYDQPTPVNNQFPFTEPVYEIEKRMQTIEQSGMTCLGVIADIRTDDKNPDDPNWTHKRISDPDNPAVLESDLTFAKKVVRYLGNRCNLYEIGNEPDLNVYPDTSGRAVPHLKIDEYMERWNEFVPALRAINPHAKFIGPVTYNAQGNDCIYPSGDCYMRLFLQKAKASGVLPDAVSFHWYPCDNVQADACLQLLTRSLDPQYNPTTFADVVRMVRRWIREILGKNVPLGITEWNFDPGSNPLGENADFMTKFTNLALNGPNGIISAGLDFANQFDAQDYGGYGHLDMFDISKHDQPKAQYYVIRSVISQYRI